MTGSDIHVRRHVVACRVVGEGPAGDRAVRAALDGPLAACLDDALARAAPDGYWVIRRLEVAAQVAAGWTSDEVAARLAQDLVRELARRTQARSDPEVLWFPDRAAYLAQYLVDRAAGRASTRWEYDALGSVSPVVLAETEPADLVLALLRLTPAELQRTAEGLSGDEEAALLGTLRRADQPGLLVPAIRRLAAPRLAATPRPALLLAATAAACGASFGAVAGPALAVGGLLSARHRVDWEELLGLVGDGRWAAAAQVVDPDLFLPFVPWPAAQRQAVAHELRSAPTADPARLHTPLGGCFLLLRLLPDLWSWPDATRSWPRLGEIPAHRVAHLVTVTAALGRGIGVAAAEDALCRLATGCESDLTDLVDYIAALTPEQVGAFEVVAGERLPVATDLETRLPPPFEPSRGTDLLGRAAGAALAQLGRSLPGMAGSSPAYLWANVLDVPAWLTDHASGPVVEVGHPPLGVLLSISGLNRGELDVGGEVPWTLTTQG